MHSIDLGKYINILTLVVIGGLPFEIIGLVLEVCCVFHC